MENGTSFSSISSGGNFNMPAVLVIILFIPSLILQHLITPADSPGYFYNSGNNQTTQQQGLGDHLQQEEPQPQTPYPLSSSASSLFRFGQSPIHGISSPALARALSTLSADKSRRARGEKKPIPDEQKDDKYYERRRRNNEAAKKSRDARKAREDELAIRASFLEKDNSILKVQVRSMRDEAMKLRELWVAKCQGMAMNRQVQQSPQGQNIVQVSGQNHVQNSFGQQVRSS